MTPLAQPAASPIPGGVENLACIWDNMGYHGIFWASMEQRTARHPPRPALNRLLTTPALKEWLRFGRFRCRPELRPAATGIRAANITKMEFATVQTAWLN